MEHFKFEIDRSFIAHLALGRHRLVSLHFAEYIIPRFLVIFLFIYWVGMEPRPILLRPLIGLLHLPLMIDGHDYGAIGMNNLQGNPNTPRKLTPVCKI
jgi:hypothetical protein